MSNNPKPMSVRFEASEKCASNRIDIEAPETQVRTNPGLHSRWPNSTAARHLPEPWRPLEHNENIPDVIPHNKAWRVEKCDKRKSWILQYRRGRARWIDCRVCSTRKYLISAVEEKCADVDDGALRRLAALPELFEQTSSARRSRQIT